MSFKKNMIASYASQIYVTLISIVMVPVYIKYMGSESYGLIGFFAMLQAWFQLLDIGLTPTMARETARFRGGGTDALSFRRLLRVLEVFFFGVALTGGASLAVSAPWIALNWLKVEQLPLLEVERAIMLMAVIVAMRWVCGLYRGVINGFEDLTWLGGFNSAIATIRFVFVIPLFIFIGKSPIHFFLFQLGVAAIELILLLGKTYRLLPSVSIESTEMPAWEWAALRGTLIFSLSMAFTSSVWVLVTQVDKFLLSKLLSLSDYGYFTLAVLLASGVTIVGGPISSALLPRMTRLAVTQDEQGLVALYRSATRLVVAIAVPVALVLAIFSNEILYAWTGNALISAKAAPVLSLYALGNGVLVVAAFPYYFQYAVGDLKLHLIGNVLFLVLLVPSIFWATGRYGATGAGYAWLVANLIYFFIWIPVVHRRLKIGLHMRWLLSDVTVLCLLTTTVVCIAWFLVDFPDGRLPLAVSLIIVYAVICFVTLMGWRILQHVQEDRPVMSMFKNRGGEND